MSNPPLILIVEDNVGSLMLATVMLENEGFEVAGAESAEEARQVLATKTPDLILMDIQLPGMDGIEFTKELKADSDTAAIPVIALTAQTMPLYERAARAAGCEVVDGREALVRQGAKSLELWTGRPAPIDAMRAAVRL